MKKPDKKKACGCHKAASCCSRKDLVDEIGRNLQSRIDVLSSIGAKAADVLKHILVELKDARKIAEDLNRMPVENPVSTASSDEAVKYVSRVVDDESCSEACGSPDGSARDCTDTPPVQMLFAQSSYAIDPGEMYAYRHPELDKDDGLAYEFVASVERRNGSSTYVYNESFVAFLYESLDKTVRLFDEKVASLKAFRFLTKKQVASDRMAAVSKFNEVSEANDDFERKVRSIISEDTVTLKPKDPKAEARMRKAIEKARSLVGVPFGSMPPPLSQLKRFLLDKSGYRIPVKRFKIVADRVDRKSQKYVYELRFFQKDYTKTPVDDQSYERAAFRLPMKGFDEKKTAARFDKAVAGLKFNAFEEKKNVR